MHQSSSKVEKVVLVFDESKSIKPYEWKGWVAHYVDESSYDHKLYALLENAQANNRMAGLAERLRVANGYEWRVNGHALICSTEAW